VYYVEIEQLSKKNFTAITMTFNVTKFDLSTPMTKSINIDGNFEEWYAANKENIAFYVPPARVPVDDGLIEEEIEIVNEDGTITKKKVKR